MKRKPEKPFGYTIPSKDVNASSGLAALLKKKFNRESHKQDFDAKLS